MNITDPAMLKKLNKTLNMSGNLFDLNDIEIGLNNGDMQGHVEGDTWAITQIHRWPRRKAVDIMFLVGSMDNSLKLFLKVEDWAKEMGADLITTVSRDGWERLKVPGWKKIGNFYSKDI
jgi:hypothetical protein